MSDALFEHLRFYRDLGFDDLYVSAESLRSGAQAPVVSPEITKASAKPAPLAASSAAPRATVPPVSMPPNKTEYQPPAKLAGSAAGAGAAPSDPLPVLNAIRADIGDCKRCRLHEGRTNIVFGVGDPKARLVFVGEGPGADEDAQGIPFVGRAGQLLTQMINNTAAKEAVPITRDDVYICNVVKCRPPGNRAPEGDEMEICGQFLERQLDAIRPKAICVLGGTAAKALLNSKVGITKMRGEWQEWRGIPVMPTFHPSFLLRGFNAQFKRQAWEDLKKVLHYVYD
jgi:DNA polymerase